MADPVSPNPKVLILNPLNSPCFPHKIMGLKSSSFPSVFQVCYALKHVSPSTFLHNGSSDQTNFQIIFAQSFQQSFQIQQIPNGNSEMSE